MRRPMCKRRVGAKAASVAGAKAAVVGGAKVAGAKAAAHGRYERQEQRSLLPLRCL